MKVLIKKIIGNLQARSTYLKLGPKTNVIMRGAVEGPGVIEFGIQWNDTVPLQSNLMVRAGAVIRVKGNFRVYSGAVLAIAPGGCLTLGSGFINNEARIACVRSITIGDDVAIGPQVYITDDDHHSIVGSPERDKAIRIGNRVWIGAGVKILKGVTIGDGAVVAAGAVVTKDVAPGSLVAGVPARHLKFVDWV